LIAADCLPLLVDIAVLAHLHVNRAKLHAQTNVIEAAKGTAESEESEPKEWYYNDRKGERQGPISFRKVGNQASVLIPESKNPRFNSHQMRQHYIDGTLFEKSEIWAEGLDKWCHLSSVAQFRWTICCSGKHSRSNLSSANSTGAGSDDGDAESGIFTLLLTLELTFIIPVF
jgi:hypothetical protein